MNDDIPESIKDLRDFWQTQFYKTASRYSQCILARWKLSEMAHGTQIEKRKQILCACRAQLQSTPSYYDFALAVGLVHEAVSILSWNELFAKADLPAPLNLTDLPGDQDGTGRLLRAVAADVLLHFPHELKEFVGKDQDPDEEFSVKWLYLFHSAIAQAASRCLEYLDIHIPDSCPENPRYYP